VKPPKFDASEVTQKIINYACDVGWREPGGVVVEVPKERIRAFAEVPRMSARREQKINTELRKIGCGHMNANGTALVSSTDGPRVISAAEAEFIYQEIKEERENDQSI